MVDAARRAGTLERTAIIVTGDHGFVNVRTSFSPNILFVQAGLHEDRPDRGDWRAAFHPASGSAFLRLRDAGDTAVIDEVREILRSQPPEVRSLYRVVEADELRLLGADPESPLAIAAAPGVSIGGATRGSLVGAASGGAHGYFPHLPEIHTGFIAWGAGTRAGDSVDEIRLTDIAPIVATLLGIEFNAPDGALPVGIVSGR